AGLAEGFAFTAVVVARGGCQSQHRRVVDVGGRLGVFTLAARVPEYGVVAGIGLDAAAPPATALRAVGNVDHMAELAARGMRAGKELAAQNQSHADAVRQQDGEEIVAVAVGRAAAQGN